MVTRKKSSLPTRIWSFAAKVPKDQKQVCDNILGLSHAYSHRLIRIEETRLKEYRATRKHYVPKIGELERAIHELLELPTKHEDKQDALDDLRKQLRVAVKKFDDQCAPAREEKARRKKEFAGCGPAIIARVNSEILEEMLESPRWSDAWKDIAMAERDAEEQVKKARAESGLAKGTYIAVEAAVQSAVRDSRPQAPRLPSWDGSGRIAVQLDKNNTWKDILDGRNGFVRVTYADDRPLGERGNSRIRCWKVQIRIGSEPGGRKPVWFELSTRLHRIPPDDAIVKWAWLRVFQTAGTPQYRFQLTLEHESFEWKPQKGAMGTLELECCHEPTADGVRVARWKGSDGKKGEVVVSRRMLSGFSHAHGLRSVVDKVRLEGYRCIAKWLAITSENKLRGWNKLKKDWRRQRILALCQEYVNHVGVRAPNDSYRSLWSDRGHWKNQGTAEQRFALWLDSWLRKERHLWRYWRGAEKRAVNIRNEFFRREAHALRRRYAILSSDTAHLVPTTNMSEEERASRQASAPGVCRSMFREAFGLSRAAGSRGTSKTPKKQPKQKRKRSQRAA